MPDELEEPKKPDAVKTDQAQEFFIRLSDPISLRRNVLESSKESLGILKTLYALQQARDRKKDLYISLKKEMKELRILVQKMEELMPQYSKADVKKFFPKLELEKKKPEPPKRPVQQPRPQTIAAPPPPPKPAPRPLTEEEILEARMQDVERKMMSLPPKQAQREAPPRPAQPSEDDTLAQTLADLKKKLGNI